MITDISALMIVLFYNDSVFRANHRCTVGDVVGDDASCSDLDVVSNPHPANDGSTRADQHVVTDGGGTAVSFSDGDPVKDRAVFSK
jgi:hypothetical protein